MWYVPNGGIARVGNKSQQWSRAVLDIPVSYGADIDARAAGDRRDRARRSPHDAERGRELILAEPEVLGCRVVRARHGHDPARREDRAARAVAGRAGAAGPDQARARRGRDRVDAGGTAGPERNGGADRRLGSVHGVTVAIIIVLVAIVLDRAASLIGFRVARRAGSWSTRRARASRPHRAVRGARAADADGRRAPTSTSSRSTVVVEVDDRRGRREPERRRRARGHRQAAAARPARPDARRVRRLPPRGARPQDRRRRRGTSSRRRCCSPTSACRRPQRLLDAVRDRAKAEDVTDADALVGLLRDEVVDAARRRRRDRDARTRRRASRTSGCSSA